MAHQLNPSGPGVGMCQYDRSALPPHIIRGALATHPTMVTGGRHQANPDYQPSL